MFVLKLRLSKKGVGFFALALSALMALLVSVMVALPGNPKGGSKSERKAYIYSLGYRFGEESKKEIVIPERFGKLYEKYNSLQKEAGMGLEDYAGEKAMLYSYKLSNFGENDVYLNLIVFEEKIIGGDVSTLYSDGFMLPLASREDNLKAIERKRNGNKAR